MTLLIADAVFTVFVAGRLSFCWVFVSDYGDGSYDGIAHQKKGAHIDMTYELCMREVTLLFVVEFWCIHGNLTSEVEVYILW